MKKKTPARGQTKGAPQASRTASQPEVIRDTDTDVEWDRLSIVRLIQIRTKELDLRRSVQSRLRGTRRAENAAEIARLTKGIAALHRNGLTRLRRWRTVMQKAEGQS